MTTKRDIHQRIEQDLQGPEVDLCRVVVNFLTSEEAKRLRHITYITLVNGAGYQCASPEQRVLLVKVTDYLSSNRMHLLNMHFQFIQNDDSDPIPVDNDEISLALHSGTFYHPENGQLVENFGQYLFPYFTPTEKLGEIYG